MAPKPRDGSPQGRLALLRDLSGFISKRCRAERELRLSLLVQRLLMRFSRLVCSAVVALASLAMTAQTYAKGGRGGHGGGGGGGGGHGGRGGAHGQHGGHRGGGNHGGQKQHGGGQHGGQKQDGGKHHRGGHDGGHKQHGGKHHRSGHHGHHRNHGWFGPAFYGYGYGYGYPYYYYPGPYPYHGAYPTVYRRYVVIDHYALVVSVQKALARRGYYRGPIDGIIGKGTRRAILVYRADHGLRIISRIDNELLKALG
jgi:Putative peptidoglycan binding domain